MTSSLTPIEVTLRLLVAVICGGIVGIERGRKHRPAGFRTHMIVCVGAALTIILGEYIAALSKDMWQASVSTDITRLGAQVINGIGFLGAGTIILTGKQQIKGLTTAAGLWASACMGLAIGAGFYVGALVGCILILLTIIVFSRLESFILARSRNVNIYVECRALDDIAAITAKLREHEVRIFDVEITKAKASEGKIYPSAIFTLKLPKKKPHTVVMTALAEIDNVCVIEEL